MIFWILVAALSAVVTYFVTRPLLTVEKSDLRTTDSDLAVYKDQLSEIDGELARGVTFGARSRGGTPRSLASPAAHGRHRCIDLQNRLPLSPFVPFTSARCSRSRF